MDRLDLTVLNVCAVTGMNPATRGDMSTDATAGLVVTQYVAALSSQCIETTDPRLAPRTQ
jgi:hypothetical protein